MKKMYEAPKAIKYVFNYQENVVASGTSYGPNANPKAAPQAQNNCYTGNTDEVVYGPGCVENATPKSGNP